MNDLTRLPSSPQSLIEAPNAEAGASHLIAWDADQRATALHEAGHAAAARVLGIAVKAIDIKGRRASGYVETGEGDDDRPETTAWSRCLDQACVGLAGLAATQVLAGQRMSGSHSDVSRATRLIATAIMDGLDPHPDAPFVAPYLDHSPIKAVEDRVIRRTEIVLREQFGRACDLIDRRSAQVLALATTVYERRRLTDEALEAAFREAGLDRP